jgi:TatA/E family protein of Tat protein translocase
MPVSGPELLLVAVALLVVFGASQLPKAARSISQARAEYRRGVSESPDVVKD